MSDPIQLPALRLPNGVSEEQQQFNRSVLQWLQAQRGLAPTGGGGSSGAGLDVGSFPPGTFARMAATARAEEISALAAKLVGTRVFQALMEQYDQRGRFSDLDERMQELLRTAITEEAATRSAAIRQVQETVQTGLESRATEVRELTAATGQALAGVREISSAATREGRATAGRVTQVESRLDGVNGGTASIEEVLSTTADQITGLQAQHTIKVTAGGAMAGIGVAASDPLDGPTDSYIIMVAKRFALVQDGDVVGTGPGQIDPRNPGALRLPFGVDADGIIYLNGQVRINTGGTLLQDLRGSVHAYATGTAWDDAAASSALAAFKGNSVKALGDTVTISSATFSNTRYWSGTAWVDPGVTIDGNLLVRGTITTDRLVAGAVTAVQAAAGVETAITIDQTASQQIGTSANLFTLTSTGAPIHITGFIRVSYLTTLLGGPSYAFSDVTIVIDDTEVTGFVLPGHGGPTIPNGGQGVHQYVTLPFVYRATLPAGTHTFKTRMKFSTYDSNGASVATRAGSLAFYTNLIAMENKV